MAPQTPRRLLTLDEAQVTALAKAFAGCVAPDEGWGIYADLIRAHGECEYDLLRAEYATASLRQMAARRGVTPQAIAHRLKKYGIPRRGRGGDYRRWQCPPA